MVFLSNLSVLQVLERAAALVPEKVAPVDRERRKTYKELDETATPLLAVNLSELGFSKGDRVSINIRNSIEMMIAFYGLQKCGVIVAWINPTYRFSEAEFILKNSESRAVFIFREGEGYDYLASILEIEEAVPELDSIVVVGNGQGQGVHSFDELIKKKPREISLPLLWISAGTFPCSSLPPGPRENQKAP